MSGDEAYFIVWAKHPDFGYYDHPPMVGWLLQLMLSLGSSELVLRLPAILLTSVIGIGIYLVLKPHDETKAALVAILVSGFTTEYFECSDHHGHAADPVRIPVCSCTVQGVAKKWLGLVWPIRCLVRLGIPVKVFCCVARVGLSGIFYFFK